MDYQRQQQYNQSGEEGSFNTEPTPVPNEYRPPPQTYQVFSTAKKLPAATTRTSYGSTPRRSENTLLNSTLLSLSLDDGGTLPSLSLNPPSPLSQPSPSLFDDERYSSLGTQVCNSTNEYQNNTNRSEMQSMALLLARRQQQQERQQNRFTVAQENGKKEPPMHEIFTDDRESNPDKNVDGTDAFYECIEDPSRENRGVQSLRSGNHLSPSRSVLSSIDGRSHYNCIEREIPEHRLENIEEGIASEDVVRVQESALIALQHLKEELVKANERNEELTRERETLKDEEKLLKQQLSLLQTTDHQRDTDLKRLREDYERLQFDYDNIEMQRNGQIEEKQKIETQSRESTRTIKELRHRVLAGDNRHRELKGNLDKKNQELESALSSKGEMEAELEKAQTERIELESKMDNLQKELSEAMHERDQANVDKQRFEEELQTERKKLEELQQLKSKVTPQVHHMSSQTSDMTFDGIQHTSMTSDFDSGMADRLARLRDSAERAHLIRSHKRELARMKSDHDAKIQQLELDHADSLKKAAKHLNEKRKMEVEELSRKLTRQHETHLEEIEEGHQKRVSQLQKDHERSQEDAEESLEQALTRMARVSQDHGREKGRRYALEKSVEELQRQLKAQKKDLQAKYGEELDKRTRIWESEKESILVTLQREFNDAFNHQRSGVNDIINSSNWVASTKGEQTVAVRSNNLHIITSDTPPHKHRHPASSYHNQRNQQHPRASAPSPLSMDSAPFYPESKNISSQLEAKNSRKGGPAFVVPSPRLGNLTSPINGLMTGAYGNIGLSPSVVSKSNSELDCALRETEQLVHSIL